MKLMAEFQKDVYSIKFILSLVDINQLILVGGRFKIFWNNSVMSLDWGVWFRVKPQVAAIDCIQTYIMF